MKLETRWGLLAAACGGLALALWLGRRDRSGHGAANVALHEWENEGGTPASAAHPSASASTPARS
jgi:hypothetical protein